MARKKTPPHGFDFDRAQAAEYVGESVATLNEWATHRPVAKNLPYVVAGGKAWYRRDDLDAFLRNKIRKAKVAA